MTQNTLLPFDCRKAANREWQNLPDPDVRKTEFDSLKDGEYDVSAKTSQLLTCAPNSA